MSPSVTPTVENTVSRKARLKREAADRSRAYRSRKKQERSPEQRVVDAAIVEALAFVLNKYGPLIAAQKSGKPLTHASVPVVELLKVAGDVLVHAGYNRPKSSAAIAERVVSRPEHRDPERVPSIRPTDDPARIRPPRLWPGDQPRPPLPFRRIRVPMAPTRSLVDMLTDDDDEA